VPFSREKWAYNEFVKLRLRLVICLLLAWAVLFILPNSSTAQDVKPRVLLLVADDPVAPPMVEFIQRGLLIAEQEEAEVVILQLNTPGGTIAAMNEIVQDIRASSIPVVVWVAPRGAMAASAGTVITLAGHASAMAPETTIGAASPVGSQGEDLGQTLEAKEKNILKAQVRSLAQGRSEEAVRLAEEMIDSALAVSAEEAFKIGLVDFIASDVQELVDQLDGFEVTVQGENRVLETSDATVREIYSSFIERLLAVLASPNIVFLLITIGVQAILIEISSPGGWIAGFIGVVCLALATYGLGILPVNWFGIVFLVTAFVLFILDIKAPTHGGLTAAGVASLIVGALVLFNSPNVPDFQRVSVPLVVGSSLMTGGVFLIFLFFGVRAQKTPLRVGQECLVGKIGIVQVELAPSGVVLVGGEQWSAQIAESEGALPRGSRVVVESVVGLRLVVRKAS